MSGGVELARSTFNRHKDAIEDIFDIIIDCDKRDVYRYYIANEEVLDNNSVQNWMIPTMSVSNVLSENLSLRNRILLEKAPSGGDNLQLIIKAVEGNYWLSVDYKSYHSAQAEAFTLAPYCVKLYRQRWYVLSKLQNDEMRIFSLDRFQRLETTSDKFAIDADFETFMSPTLDFYWYILSRNCQAKIFETQWLANEIHDMHLYAVMMYEGE